jgi:hypothetical protein
MTGRIRRKLIEASQVAVSAPERVQCELCGRAIEPSQLDLHHLIPKSQGGRETVPLHRICHRQIHALLTEKELARDYPTIGALLSHTDIARFIAWIRVKPAGFIERTAKSQRLRRR